MAISRWAKALISELLSVKEYKFLHPPSQHRLQSIKELQAWFTGIAKMLDRFPNVEAFLFGTAASLNEDQELSIRITAVKSEKGVKQEHSPPDDITLRRAISAELRTFDREFTDFNVVAEFFLPLHMQKKFEQVKTCIILLPQICSTPVWTPSQFCLGSHSTNRQNFKRL